MPGSLVIPLPFVYTTQGDIERYISAQGVKLRLDDNNDGVIDPVYLQTIMTDAIAEATETVNYYCFDKFSPSVMATSNLVNRIATFFAAYRICGHRLNPIPSLVVEDCAKWEERLKEIRDGQGKLPGVPLRRKLAPVMSLTRVVPWPYQFRCIRVERLNSSQHNKTTIGQNVDYQESQSSGWDLR